MHQKLGGRRRPVGAPGVAPAAHLEGGWGLAVEAPLQPLLLGLSPLGPPPQCEERRAHQQQHPHAGPYRRHVKLEQVEPGRVLRHLCGGVHGGLLLLLLFGAAAAAHLGKLNYILQHHPDQNGKSSLLSQNELGD